jgi:hypothetical protein
MPHGTQPAMAKDLFTAGNTLAAGGDGAAGGHGRLARRR